MRAFLVYSKRIVQPYNPWGSSQTYPQTFEDTRPKLVVASNTYEVARQNPDASKIEEVDCKEVIVYKEKKS